MEIAVTLNAINDPVRQEILLYLRDGKKSAGEIAENFDLKKPTISYHLKKLKDAGLLYETRNKNYIYYELNTSVFEDIMLWCKIFTKRGNNEKDIS